MDLQRGLGAGLLQIVLKSEDEEIAGVQAQVGRLMAILIDITIAGAAVRVDVTAKRELHFQDALRAAQIVRLWDDGM